MVDITTTLEKPAQIHDAHQFVDKVCVCVTATARNQRKVTGKGPFACRRPILRQQECLVNGLWLRELPDLVRLEDTDAKVAGSGLITARL